MVQVVSEIQCFQLAKFYMPHFARKYHRAGRAGLGTKPYEGYLKELEMFSMERLANIGVAPRKTSIEVGRRRIPTNGLINKGQRI